MSEACQHTHRNYQVDNIRALLIFLVVLGHLIPLNNGGINSNPLYSVIYSFHMALFVFVNGIYARFDRKKILKHYIWPYIFFQTAYYYFCAYILHDNTVLQFTTPYWLLWYLMTMITYLCLIPLLKTGSHKHVLITVAGTFLLAIITGFDNTIGKYLSLSRTICFLPFFLLGFYHNLLIDEKTRAVLRKPYIAAFGVIGIIVLEFALCMSNSPVVVLHHTGPYDIIMRDAGIRLILEAIGLAWIVLLFAAIPDRPIKLITTIGQNTMPIYLLHGFIAKYVSKCNLLHYGRMENEIIATIAAMMIVIVLGNRQIGRIFRKLF
jgi:Fucose 4-O-acetylase and related acetyltransferases